MTNFFQVLLSIASCAPCSTEIDVAHVVEELRKRDIVLIPWTTPHTLRLVTHHEVNQAAVGAVVRAFADIVGRGLHSSAFQLNLSRI